MRLLLSAPPVAVAGRYGFAALVVAAALGLDLALSPLIQANTFPLFQLAVVAATWYGGLGPGLAATAIAAVANAYFFVTPGRLLGIATASEVTRHALFVGSALAAAVLVATLRSARRRAGEATRETRRHEEEVRQSAELMRLSVEVLVDSAIFGLDADGRVMSWNAGAERLMGYAADEIAGKHVSTFYLAEDAASGKPDEVLRQAAATGRAEAEGWRVRNDGGRFFANVVVTPARTPDGALRGFSKVVRNITERKRAEDALRASEARVRDIIESAPDGIIIADVHGRISLANAQASKIFGYTAAELVGQPVEMLMPDGLRRQHVEHRGRYLAAPTTRPMGLGLDLIGRRKDGSEVPVEISLSPMRTPDGILVTSVIRDITERKHTEAQIKRLNEDLVQRVAELAAVNQELEAFSYSVSHDLRAPLRGIDGFSKALLEDHAAVLDDQGKDYLARIRAATRRMGALIDDLLNLSRVTRREMRRERVDLTALARSIARQLERTSPERRVEWIIGEGVSGSGDETLLRAALENLLGNAWKFTGRQATARIEFGVVPADSGQVYVVRDNGVGFDMAYAGKLFGAFQRLHAAHEFPGTGIGLATVQRIVHRHGGRVWAEAEPGKGASFYFTLGEATR